MLAPLQDADGFLPELDTATGFTTTRLSLVGAGDCRLRADQDGFTEAGDPSSYAPAPSVAHTFTVLSAGATTQVITTLSVGATLVYGDETSRTITSVANSGLRVLLSGTDGVCSVGTSTLANGQTTAQVVFLQAGTCTILAEQPGDNTYAAATDVTDEIVITPRTVTVTGITAEDKVYDGTTTATLRTAQGGLGLTGVVPGDSLADITVEADPNATTPVGQFTASSVASPASITVTSGAVLSGSKASSYQLAYPTDVTANITARPLTLVPQAQTITSGNTPNPCQVSVVAPTSVAAADEIDSASVSCLFGGQNAQATHTQDTTITIVSGVGGLKVVRSGSNPVDDVTSNYSITYQSATLTVQEAGQEITVENLGNLTLVYGQPIPASFLAEPRAKRNGADVTGSFTHKLPDGTELTAGTILDANTQGVSITVEFTETAKNTPGSVTSRTITVTKRPVTYTFTGPSKVYDGTTSIDLPSFSLTGVPNNSDSGIVGNDTVTITSPTRGTLQSADVGSSTLTFTTPTLGGAKAANYALQAPSQSPGGTVTARPISIRVGTFARFVGEPDPALEILQGTNGTDEGVAPNETFSQVLGSGSSISKVGYTADQVGSYALQPAVPNVNPNYQLRIQNGTLYIADVQFGVQETAGVLDTKTVTCNCEGFAPNTTATFTINSTPTTLATVTVDSNGTCPGTTATIPDTVPDGDHTLRLTGSFPTGDPAVKDRAVRLGTPAIQNPPTQQTPTTPPRSTRPETRAPETTAPQGPLATPPTPRFTPAPTPPTVTVERDETQPAAPGNGPGNAGQSQPTTQSDQPPRDNGLSGLVQRTALPENTFDVGGGELANPGGGLSPSTITSGKRTVQDMRQETLGGFQPGSGLRIEALGSRTTARFVLSTLTEIDDLVLLEQIRRSAQSNTVDFAQLVTIESVDRRTQTPPAWSDQQREDAQTLFEFSRLAPPVQQEELLRTGPYTWLSIEVEVSEYLPGSIVYLTATSSPVVFAEAIVGDDGRASIRGDVAVELLGLGEHRFRAVGTRVFDGITVDDAGELTVPDAVLEEVQLFDRGTDATVILTGNNDEGGIHTALRIIPLDPVSPWWTLWVIGWTAFLVLFARLRGMLATVRERAMGSVVVTASSIPAIYLGWTSEVTQVTWWGLGMGFVLSFLVWVLPTLSRKDTRR